MYCRILFRNYSPCTGFMMGCLWCRPLSTVWLVQDWTWQEIMWMFHTKDSLVLATMRLQFPKRRKPIWRTHQTKGPGRELDSYWGPLQRAVIIPRVLCGSISSSNFARNHCLFVSDIAPFTQFVSRGPSHSSLVVSIEEFGIGMRIL